MKLTEVTSELVISERKITDYLLNQAHAEGWAKAGFLIRFGFTLSGWEELREALLAHARANVVANQDDGVYGKLYDIEGPMPSPDQRNPHMRAVWQIDFGRSEARFITLFPLKGVWHDQ